MRDCLGRNELWRSGKVCNLRGHIRRDWCRSSEEGMIDIEGVSELTQWVVENRRVMPDFSLITCIIGHSQLLSAS